MRNFVLLGVILVLGLAFAEELDASTTDNQGFQGITNCDLTDGPYKFYATFHTSEAPGMAPSTPVYYDVFNLTTGSWDKMGRACSVDSSSCKLLIPVILGGTGSGEKTYEAIRLYATHPLTGLVYEKAFTFKFDHIPSATENTIIEKEGTLKLKLPQLKSAKTCEGAICCKSLGTKISQIQVDVDSISANLALCKSQAAYNTAVSSIASIDALIAESGKCSAALASYGAADAVVNKALPQNCAYDSMGAASFNSATEKLASAKGKLETGSYEIAADLESAKSDATAAQQKVSCNEGAGTGTTGTGSQGTGTTGTPPAGTGTPAGTGSAGASPCGGAFVLLGLMAFAFLAKE